MVAQPNTVTIWSKEITPSVGTYIIPDGKTVGKVLTPGDVPVDSGYPGSQFRWPVENGGPIKSVAVNIEITGHTLQRKHGGYCVRVKMEWVGDCEPSTFSSGWLFVN